MASDDFLKVTTLIYEYDETDHIIGTTDSKPFKRNILIQYATIFYIMESLDKRETEIILIDGESIIALEKFAVIEEKWQAWNDNNNSLINKTKIN